MKKILSLIIILSIAVVCCACGVQRDPSGISLEEFEKIDTGMEYNDVLEIIGGKGIEISSSEHDTDEYTENVYVYKFKGETTGYAEIEFTKRNYKDILKMNFDDPEVTKKTQYDLSYTNKKSDVDESSYDFENDSSSATLETSCNLDDYNEMSTDKYAEKLAKEFSTNSIKLAPDKYSEDLYFLRTDKTEFIDVTLGCGKYKTIDFMLVYHNDSEKNLCYDFFKNAINANIFSFSDEEQSLLLQGYGGGSIDFENNNFRVLYSNEEKNYVETISVFFK